MSRATRDAKTSSASLDRARQSLDDSKLVIQDLPALLLEFESCDRLAREMNAQRLSALTVLIREAIFHEYTSHGRKLPLRDGKTKRVSWKDPRTIRSADFIEHWESARDSSDCFDVLHTTLDRLFTPGVRRNPQTGKVPRPRLAEHVAKKLTENLTLDEAKKIVRNCLMYAIYHELHSEVRRRENGGVRRVKAAPRQRTHDKRALLRRFSSTKLLALDDSFAADIAYCVSFEYQRGKLDRAVVLPFANLRVGDGTVSSIIAAIDDTFQRSDEELAQKQPHSTRRRPANEKGIGAPEFARILQKAGLSLAETSLSSLYKRKAARIVEALT